MPWEVKSGKTGTPLTVKWYLRELWMRKAEDARAVRQYASRIAEDEDGWAKLTEEEARVLAELESGDGW